MSLSQSFSQKIGNVRPLNPCPSLDIDFANGGYLNNQGNANQQSPGSANFLINSFNGVDPVFTRASAATFRGSNGLIQYAPENLIFPSDVLTTQTRTATPTQHTISFYGTGSISLSGAAIGTVIGSAAGVRTSYTFTPTAGSLTLTVSGSVTSAQLERSSTARPYISTTTAARYGPRFEYDLSGNPLGLLMEEQSQNLVQYSEQFDNAYWNKTGAPVSITSNSINAPNGLLVSDRMFETTDNLGHAIFTDSSNPSVVSGITYSLSVFCKKGTGATAPDWVQVFPRSAGFGNLEYANFNISTGSTGSYSGSIAPKIEHVGNGWYRCIMFAIATSTTSTNTGFTVGFTNNNGSSLRLPTYVGSITSDVYIWGAQLEAKPFATSYIPTVASSVVRNADVLNSTIGSWYNADEGTIVVKGDRTGFNIQDSLFEFTSGTTASLAHRGDGTDENFLVEDAGTTVTIVETIPLNSPLYFAASYSDPATQVNATVNAEPVQGTTLASTITTPTTLNIGYSPEISTYFNGHIKAFRYYAKDWPSKLEFFTLTA